MAIEKPAKMKTSSGLMLKTKVSLFFFSSRLKVLG